MGTKSRWSERPAMSRRGNAQHSRTERKSRLTKVVDWRHAAAVGVEVSFMATQHRKSKRLENDDYQRRRYLTMVGAGGEGLSKEDGAENRRQPARS